MTGLWETGEMLVSPQNQNIREAKMNNNHISRRSLLGATAAAGLYGLTGPRAYGAEVNWKKYAGTTLEANLVKGPRGELLQKYAAEFTELTGIKVEVRNHPGTAAAAEGRHRADLRQAEF